jgi:hypothetical protein
MASLCVNRSDPPYPMINPATTTAQSGFRAAANVPECDRRGEGRSHQSRERPFGAALSQLLPPASFSRSAASASSVASVPAGSSAART